MDRNAKSPLKHHKQFLQLGGNKLAPYVRVERRERLYERREKGLRRNVHLRPVVVGLRGRRRGRPDAPPDAPGVRPERHAVDAEIIGVFLFGVRREVVLLGGIRVGRFRFVEEHLQLFGFRVSVALVDVQDLLETFQRGERNLGILAQRGRLDEFQKKRPSAQKVALKNKARHLIKISFGYLLTEFPKNIAIIKNKILIF